MSGSALISNYQLLYCLGILCPPCEAVLLCIKQGFMGKETKSPNVSLPWQANSCGEGVPHFSHCPEHSLCILAESCLGKTHKQWSGKIHKQHFGTQDCLSKMLSCWIKGAASACALKERAAETDSLPGVFFFTFPNTGATDEAMSNSWMWNGLWDNLSSSYLNQLRLMLWDICRSKASCIREAHNQECRICEVLTPPTVSSGWIGFEDHSFVLALYFLYNSFFLLLLF